MVTTLKLMPTSPWCGEGGTSLGGVRDVSGTPVSDESGTICQACIRTSQLLVMSWVFATCLQAGRARSDDFCTLVVKAWGVSTGHGPIQGRSLTGVSAAVEHAQVRIPGEVDDLNASLLSARAPERPPGTSRGKGWQRGVDELEDDPYEPVRLLVLREMADPLQDVEDAAGHGIPGIVRVPERDDRVPVPPDDRRRGVRDEIQAVHRAHSLAPRINYRMQGVEEGPPGFPVHQRSIP